MAQKQAWCEANSLRQARPFIRALQPYKHSPCVQPSQDLLLYNRVNNKNKTLRFFATETLLEWREKPREGRGMGEEKPFALSTADLNLFALLPAE